MYQYVPFYTNIWSDKRFKQLDIEAQLMFIYLFGNTQVTITGIYNLDFEIFQLKVKPQKRSFQVIFQDILNSNMIEWDKNNEIIFVKNRFKLIPNNNSVKIISGAIKELNMMTHPFKDKFIEIYNTQIKKLKWRFNDYELTEEEITSEEFITNAAKFYNTKQDLKRFIMNKGISEQKIDEIISKVLPKISKWTT